MTVLKPLCARCELSKVLVVETSIGSVCRLCFNRMSAEGFPCSNCGAVGQWVSNNPVDVSLGPVCGSCAWSLAPIIGRCASCKRNNLRLPNNSDRGRICGNCYQLGLPLGICSRCGKKKRTKCRHPDDDPNTESVRRVCESCFKLLVYGIGRCPECDALRRLRWLDPRLEQTPRTDEVIRICGGCYDKLTKISICPECDSEAVLKYVHPDDRKKESDKRRHVCRRCYEDLAGLQRRGEKKPCPRCSKQRDLRNQLDFFGVVVAVCRSCFYEVRYTGPCSNCGNTRVLWKIHPADRKVPSDKRRRVCMTCVHKLNKEITED